MQIEIFMYHHQIVQQHLYQLIEHKDMNGNQTFQTKVSRMNKAGFSAYKAIMCKSGIRILHVL